MNLDTNVPGAKHSPASVGGMTVFVAAWAGTATRPISAAQAIATPKLRKVPRRPRTPLPVPSPNIIPHLRSITPGILDGPRGTLRRPQRVPGAPTDRCSDLGAANLGRFGYRRRMRWTRCLAGGSAVTLVLSCSITSPALSASSSCEKAPGGGLTLANIAADGPRLRAVGSDGLIAASGPNGRWRIQPTPVQHALRGVVWTGSRWVVVGDAGTILRRSDDSWITAPGIPNVGLRGIAAVAGRIVASGSNGTVVSSPDGITWAPALSGTTNILWGGTTAGSALLLSGENTTVLTSTDGLSFAPLLTNPRPTDSTAAPRPFIWQLAHSGGNLVGVGDFGAIIQGPRSGPLRGVVSPTDEILRGVEAAEGTFVAVGSGGEVLYSENGHRWRLGSSPTTVDLRGVAFDGERWRAVGDQSTVISSRNGRRWRVDVTAMPCALLGLASSASQLVAVGGSGRVSRSSDGRSWQPTRRVGGRPDLYSVTHGPGAFVAVGADGVIVRSKTGRTWRRQDSSTSVNLHTITWTGDRFLAGGDRGVILRSESGRRWHKVDFDGFHSVRAFASDGTTDVAVGAGTVARRPAPGQPWQLEEIGFGRFQTGVAYGKGRFVAVGHNGGVLVSTDAGATWSPGVSGVEVNLDTVLWTGSAFLATGEGTAITSADGLTWTPVSLGTAKSIRALVTFDGAIVGVGDGGATVRLP